MGVELLFLVMSGVEAMAQKVVDKICRPEGQVLHLGCDHAHLGGSGKVGCGGVKSMCGTQP